MQMSMFYEKVADYLAKKGLGVKEVIAKYAERGAKVSEMNGYKSS
jgi:Rod binding domain-containing protein